ncbi:MAG TPA: hypothetical protein PKL15_17465, partial [Saprospiraceae bacterium]|nr:hypothetical protein [Saprospiraceae bacterium]
DEAENDKFPFNNVEQKQLLAVNLDKGKREENSDKGDAHPDTCIVESAFRFFWIHPYPVAFLIYSGKVIAKFITFLKKIIDRGALGMHCAGVLCF